MTTTGRTSRRKRDPRFVTAMVLPLVAVMVGLVTLGHLLSRHGGRSVPHPRASAIERAWQPAGPPVALAREQLQPAGRARDGQTLWRRPASGGGGGGPTWYQQVAPGRYQPVRATGPVPHGHPQKEAPGTGVPGASEPR